MSEKNTDKTHSDGSSAIDPDVSKESSQSTDEFGALNNDTSSSNNNSEITNDVIVLEEKLKRALADYDNLYRKMQSDIKNGVNARVIELVLDFLETRDDFVRAIEVFTEKNVNREGLDRVLKNMDVMLKKHNVTPIDAIGEIFDPNLHEAISVVEDSALDDGTIVREIRKGYISHNVTVRPSLVEISKKGIKND